MAKINQLEISDNNGNIQKVFKGRVTVVPYKQKMKGVKWTMVFQEMLQKIAADKELTGNDKSVLLYLISSCDFDNWIKVSQQYISDKILIPRQKVNESIQKLRRKNYIRLEKVGKDNAYQINAHIAWKGDAKDRNKVIQLFDNLKPV